MKLLIFTLLRDFSRSLIAMFFLLVVALFLLDIDLSYAIDFGWIGFCCAFVFYYSISRTKITNDWLLPVIHKNALKTFFFSMLVSILILLTLIKCIDIFHGKASLSKEYKWTSFAPVIFIFTSAAMEEVLFRGYLSAILNSKLNKNIALILVAVFFSIAHMKSNIKFIYLLSYFLFSICLSLVANQTNSLIPAITYHTISNYVVGLSSLKLNGMFDYSGVFSFENGAPTRTYIISRTVVALIFITGFYSFKAFREKK